MTPDSYRQDSHRAATEPDGEALLQSEIEFWQETIGSCPVTQSADSIERMHQALALAESRLEKLRAESRAMDFLATRKH